MLFEPGFLSVSPSVRVPGFLSVPFVVFGFPPLPFGFEGFTLFFLVSLTAKSGFCGSGFGTGTETCAVGTAFGLVKGDGPVANSMIMRGIVSSFGPKVSLSFTSSHAFAAWKLDVRRLSTQALCAIMSGLSRQASIWSLIESISVYHVPTVAGLT